MRIRTIKPEFWTHPTLSRLDPMARLLAIALLNYADDEGFFDADEVLVRGAVMPREDSSNVRRSIDDLSRIGYIEVREHPERGPIGCVVHFSRHQRVDRPKPSALKELWNSTNDRRTIDERSTQEGNREGKGREVRTEANASVVHQPELIHAPTCPFEQIVTLFHQTCTSLKPILSHNDSRRAAVRSRWRQVKGRIDAFEVLFAKTEASDFLTGRKGNRGWQADFDWLMKQKNFVRILEGHYDNDR